MKAFQLLILFFFLTAIISEAQIQVGQNIYGEGQEDKFPSSVSLSDDGLTLVATATSNDGNGNNSGHMRIFRYNGSIWTQLGSDIDGETPDEWFGETVSISADGNTVASGAKRHSPNGNNHGRVRIFSFDGTNWIQRGQSLNGSSSEYFGVSVALSNDGNVIVVGANRAGGGDRGLTYVYQYDGVNWTQIGSVIQGEASSDRSGGDVNISEAGNIIAIGAADNDGNGISAGHVRIFEFDGTDWVQLGNDIDGEAAGDWASISMASSKDGKTIIIGANQNDGNGTISGHARIFQFDGIDWVQKGQDIDGEVAYDYAGTGVSISDSGNRVVIGSPGSKGNNNNPDIGQARIFQFNGVNWVQIGQAIEGTDEQDGFGAPLSMSGNGNLFAIGSPRNDDNLLDVGQLRVFTLSGVFGNVYMDINQNCVQNSDERGAQKIKAYIQPTNLVVETDLHGNWALDSLPVGNYTITLDTSGAWTTPCNITQSFSVIHPDSITVASSFGLISKYPCTSPDISIDMPFMRPCFTDQAIYVRACNNNQATKTLNNVRAVVTLDGLILPTSFELQYTDLGNNQYQFNLDSLVRGQCKDFWIKATIDCNAQLGQAVCLDAALFPVEPCALDSIPNPFPPTVAPCIGSWDQSSLTVTGYCQNDSILFEIANVGTGSMTCYSPVNIFIDGTLLLIDSVLLNSQQTTVFSFPANGESWHLSVAQHPFHPGNSNPNATVENCGGFSGQTMINLFVQDDANPVIDIYCAPVTGSYDPNDKTGYPLGVTADHHIKANQQLQYRIRFQNTGTDTAFTVVIRDTLDTDLNIFSIRSGVASHDYDFRLYGPRVLEWTFNNIMLPDSNVNEAASHGYVTFTVDQERDLPDGTQITNSAGIYFDFNAPIITNIAQHQIHYDLPVTVDIEEVILLENKFTLYPNPNNGQFFIDLKDNYRTVNINVTDITGRVVSSNNWQNRSIIDLEINQPSGVYFVEVVVEGTKETFKVLKQ